MSNQKSLSFRSRLMLVILLLAISSSFIIVGAAYHSAKIGMTENVFNHLRSVRAAKQYQIEHYFQNTLGKVELMGNNPTLIQAVKDFKKGFHSIKNQANLPDYTTHLEGHYKKFLDSLIVNMGVKNNIDLYFPTGKTSQYLQYHYITNNPHPLGEKNKLLTAKDVSSYYNIAHEKHHHYLNSFVEKFGFYDIFLVDLETGDILYTAYKETDFGTNLYKGPYSNSNLGALVERLNENADIQKPTLIDYEYYRPSYGAPASFIGVPVTEDGKTIGALVLQLPSTEIDKVMTGNYNWEEDGLGKTGESYLVGEDCFMRSTSRFYSDDSLGFKKSLSKIGWADEEVENMYRLNTTILGLKIQTTACEEALMGKTDTKIIDDYRGVSVLSSYSPLEIADMRWAIISEMDLAEANSTLNTFKRNVFITIVLLILVLTFLSSWLANRFVLPINRLKEGIRNLKSGDFNLVTHKGNDEFTDLALHFNDMVDQLKNNKEKLVLAKEKNEELLYNFIPASIANRLLAGEKDIVENHSNASLILVDIEDFTDLEHELGEKEAVSKLNELIDAFDKAAKRHHIEKVRTLGDNYYGSCGLFTPRLDHTKRIIDFAIELKQVLKQFNKTNQLNLSLLCGISTGAITSGIVGKEQFNYDLLGQTVNQLFDIKDLKIENEILVPENVYMATQDFFEFKKIETQLQIPIYQLMSIVSISEME